MEIPTDIKKMILHYFQERNLEEVEEIVKNLMQQTLNVGAGQFIRSLLFLSEGNLDNLKSYLPVSDPRDIIVMAEKKAGNPGHYFIHPFEEKYI